MFLLAHTEFGKTVNQRKLNMQFTVQQMKEFYFFDIQNYYYLESSSPILFLITPFTLNTRLLLEHSCHSLCFLSQKDCVQLVQLLRLSITPLPTKP